METKPFNFEEIVLGATVVTRNGKCQGKFLTSINNKLTPLVFVMRNVDTGEEHTCMYTVNGMYYPDRDPSSQDLFMAD